MTGVLPYRDAYPKLDQEVFVAPGAWVVGDVVIGRASSIWFNTVVRGDENYIIIGSETNVQDNSTLHVTGDRFPLEIGSQVTIGHRAIVHGCIVEDNCLIGMGSVIMDGAKIGTGSLIAAGSVVTPRTIIPPESVVMGVPGRVKRKASELDRRLIEESVTHYLELARGYSNPERLQYGKQVKGFLG
jgi:carbonic anhydrase/acetyltransferase-like protein (isoleucine patch superfamily)